MVASLVLLTSKPLISFRLSSPLRKTAVGRISSLFSKMPSSSSSSCGTPKLLEVEQKFPFLDRPYLEERLRKEGFEPVNELTMVDWYFDRFVDDDENMHDLELPLVRRDHWLRYRETITEHGNDSEGQWQLKRINAGDSGSGGGGGATVYEEVEGIRAVEIAHSVLQEQPLALTSSRSTDVENDETRSFDGHPIPIVPIPECDVVPFARIVTHRAKWKQPYPTTVDAREDEDEAVSIGKNSNLFPNLVVDLDTTPDGFAVGEVEAVVEGEDCDTESAGTENELAFTEAAARNDRAVARARADIRQFLVVLLDDGEGEDPALSASNRRPPMGKLEQFLFRCRPRIYKVCVDSGVIPEPPPATTI